MLYSNRKRKNSAKIEQLASLQNQVGELRLHDKLGKQNYHEKIGKVFEPDTDTIKNTSEKSTKTMMETSIKNNRILDNLKHKLLEVINDRGILAC